MSRRTPPDHTAPDARAGLTQRRRDRGLPIGAVEVGEGQRRLEVKAEVERLKGMKFADLRDEALELGLGDAATRRAIDRCDLTCLRLAILEHKLNVALGGES